MDKNCLSVRLEQLFRMAFILTTNGNSIGRFGIVDIETCQLSLTTIDHEVETDIGIDIDSGQLS